ncbi:hypothetical protein CHS0354_029921 [Potamilus streckersoni]|uniref:Major facilitator superfamily (MFS) profile domain-containing protein n=1 Tax=Potamilus streckersoni TaxID=2493646 RepID=A0AAE0VIP1_9BIVA|nr:hypothetical protein CHS0354_029921 [Potamilus streckersoni]
MPEETDCVSERLQHDLLWNRTVNLRRGAGNNDEADLVNEFLTKEFKESLRSAGHQLSDATIERHSKLAGRVGHVLDTTYSLVASILTKRFGCRPVTIIGSIFASAGFILSLFATDLFHMYITFGIISGAGCGLMMLPTIVAVSQSFSKRKAIAMGIAVCGSSVGTFVLSPITEILLDTYGWKGTMLIEAGIILNCIVGASMYRIPSVKRSPSRQEQALLKEQMSALHPNQEDEENDHNNVCVEEKIVNAHYKSADKTAVSSMISDQDEDGLNAHKINAIIVSPPDRMTTDGIDISNPNTFIIQRPSHTCCLETGRQLHAHDMCEQMRDMTPFGTIKENATISTVTTTNPSSNKHGTSCPQSFINLFKVNLLKDASLQIFLLSTVILSLFYDVPFVYLPDYTLEAGYSETEAAWLLSAIGIANTIGRVLLGWLGDRPKVNRFVLYNMTLVAAGTTTVLSLFCVNYILLVINFAVFGIALGGYVALCPIVLSDLFGEDSIADSFGFSCFVGGICSLVGSPFAGWLFDRTGRYDLTFIATGIGLAFSGLIMFLIPLCRRMQRRNIRLTKCIC